MCPYHICRHTFEAQEGQRNRMNVVHGTLRATSLGLYEPDGVWAQNDDWEYRELAADGPEILWVATTSEEYYYVVRNFGGCQWQLNNGPLGR